MSQKKSGKVAKMESGEESSSYQDSSEDDSPVAIQKQQVAKSKDGKHQLNVKQQEEESSEEEENESEEEENESEEEDENEDAPKTGQKRKENAIEIPPKKAKVEMDETKAEKDKRTLFVRNLPWATDEDAVEEFFEGCEKVNLPRNDDGKVRGIAFVQFASEEEALKAMKELNNKDIGGRTIAISQAGKVDGNNSFGGNQQTNQNNNERDKRSLFVGNLSWGVDENAISELFEGCAEVRVPKRDDGKIKGFAFVEYSSEAEAVKAMENFQGSELDGRSISIERCSARQQSQGRGGRGGGGRGGGGRGGHGGRGGGFQRGGRGGGRGRGGRGGR